MECGIIYRRFPLRQVLIRRLLASSRSFELPASESTTFDSQQKPSQIPLMTGRKLEPPVYCASVQTERHAWLESLKPYSQTDSLIGMVDLHPDIFAVFPRIDLVHKNLYWQAHYRMVDWRCITTRAELPYRSRRKPWPQKGTGKARHGNRRTHIWLGGGQCKGPRGPESFFYMLPRAQRIAGLLSMLSIKHAQDDLHIVDNFDLSEPIELQAQAILDEIPSLLNPTELALDDASFESIKSRSYRLSKALNESALYLRNLVDSRQWGPSVLFVTEHTPSYDPTELSKNLENLSMDPTTYPNLGISFACNAYAHHVRAETSQEAAITLSHTISPRTTHPGRGLTLMPLQSLNVWSMVHHDTLVLSLGCLERLEQLLLKAQRSIVPDKHLDPPYLQPDPSEWTLDDEYDQQLDESC